MKAFLAAVATMAVVTAAAPFVLTQMGLSSAERGAAVRLD
ncbi:hypothetical protein SAMN05444279_11137 [Ruegeria intermedia]|uniref:Uncharacterized protein n=1 Tax=Ruegeria intermedia TaxID=996115 RepID=A0A1M4XAC8_9RHOB|nr:hypothetical protein SAMN05444279_11137 [Ruegeria intermedia]